MCAVVNNDFFGGNFAILQNIFQKEYFVAYSLFLKICQNHRNCLQSEKVLKILHFHIINIVQFGQMYIWTIAT